MTQSEPEVGLEPDRPNAARMFDYYLGGKDNFAADRAAAEMVLQVAPWMPEAARQGRELIARTVRHLVEEKGIRQILDLGSGLPTRDNVHEIAHRIDPEVRVVYVDNDPVVCSHGRALLADSKAVSVLQADLRHPEQVLAHPEIGGAIDFGSPVAVLMMFVLHLVPDEQGPQRIVASYRDALAPGSYLALSHAGTDAHPELMARISAIYQRANSPFVPRSHADIARFFGNLVLEPPGLVNMWPYAEPPATDDPEVAGTGYSGVGRKP
ncbi:SAM-dependent methyltransferase [Micromonospora sp. ALFpr18c]|uniref:SAM-dependent methyltransferase n=1 Tax=Micromonospora sp. ALFpr18c TaxID=1458665 RepID=UPI00124B6B3D|nr:SAM-dependent methyltransferase [Micromonospora sp. ALFpr18c]KAB1946740.1 SAM-dependent methyltransferase [Micromonospora sp. ALFpr18c]